MRGWLAIIPLKGRAARKTRLADVLTPEQRHAVSQFMFLHVVATLRQVQEIGRVAVLCDICPEGYSGELIHDQGRGLNRELAAACDSAAGDALAVVHADLPLLTADDVAALLAAGAQGQAIAPDRHGTGTNALALRHGAGFDFSFGADSLARHAAHGRAHRVTRTGLALDVDTADDLAAVLATGWHSGVPGIVADPDRGWITTLPGIRGGSTAPA